MGTGTGIEMEKIRIVDKKEEACEAFLNKLL